MNLGISKTSTDQADAKAEALLHPHREALEQKRANYRAHQAYEAKRLQRAPWICAALMACTIAATSSNIPVALAAGLAVGLAAFFGVRLTYWIQAWLKR